MAMQGQALRVGLKNLPFMVALRSTIKAYFCAKTLHFGNRYL